MGRESGGRKREEGGGGREIEIEIEIETVYNKRREIADPIRAIMSFPSLTSIQEREIKGKGKAPEPGQRYTNGEARARGMSPASAGRRRKSGYCAN